MGGKEKNRSETTREEKRETGGVVRRKKSRGGEGPRCGCPALGRFARNTQPRKDPMCLERRRGKVAAENSVGRTERGWFKRVTWILNVAVFS